MGGVKFWDNHVIMQAVLVICLGACAGALLRWQLELAVRAGLIPLPAWCDPNLIANLLGCLVIGVLVAHPQHPRLFLWGGVGFCGSLTTFSSWMLQVVLTLRGGQPGAALVMLLLPLAGGLVCTAVAARLAARWR